MQRRASTKEVRYLLVRKRSKTRSIVRPMMLKVLCKTSKICITKLQNYTPLCNSERWFRQKHTKMH